MCEGFSDLVDESLNHFVDVLLCDRDTLGTQLVCDSDYEFAFCDICHGWVRKNFILTRRFKAGRVQIVAKKPKMLGKDYAHTRFQVLGFQEEFLSQETSP